MVADAIIDVRFSRSQLTWSVSGYSLGLRVAKSTKGIVSTNAVPPRASSPGDHGRVLRGTLSSEPLFKNYDAE